MTLTCTSFFFSIDSLLYNPIYRSIEISVLQCMQRIMELEAKLHDMTRPASHLQAPYHHIPASPPLMSLAVQKQNSPSNNIAPAVQAAKVQRYASCIDELKARFEKMAAAQ